MRDALADGRNVGRGAERDSRAGGGVEDRDALAVRDGDVRAAGVHGEYRRGGLVHVLAAPRLAGALVIGARARASLGAGRAVLLLALALTLRHRGWVSGGDIDSVLGDGTIRDGDTDAMARR